MNVVQKKVEFYVALVVFFEADEFNVLSAKEIVEMYIKIKTHLLITTITQEILREVYLEYHDTTRSLDDHSEVLEGMFESAFKDLSAHVRMPQVRRILKDFSEMIGTQADDLYVSESSSRTYNGEVNGPAVVTLVVSNYDRFINLLSSGKVPGEIHFV